jgi:hypothetical protein
MGERIGVYTVLVGNLRERDHFGDPGCYRHFIMGPAMHRKFRFIPWVGLERYMPWLQITKHGLTAGGATAVLTLKSFCWTGHL